MLQLHLIVILCDNYNYVDFLVRLKFLIMYQTPKRKQFPWKFNIFCRWFVKFFYNESVDSHSRSYVICEQGLQKHLLRLLNL